MSSTVFNKVPLVPPFDKIPGDQGGAQQLAFQAGGAFRWFNRFSCAQVRASSSTPQTPFSCSFEVRSMPFAPDDRYEATTEWDLYLESFMEGLGTFCSFANLPAFGLQ
jgi:hypothetical protein